MSELKNTCPSLLVKTIIYTLVTYQSINIVIVLLDTLGIININLSNQDVVFGLLDIFISLCLAYGLYILNKKAWLLTVLYTLGIVLLTYIKTDDNSQGSVLFAGFIFLFYGVLLSLLLSRNILGEFEMSTKFIYLKFLPMLFIIVGLFNVLSILNGGVVAFLEVLVVFILLCKFYLEIKIREKGEKGDATLLRAKE